MLKHLKCESRLHSMQLKTISSSMTFLMKIIFPVFWISIFGIVTIELCLDNLHGNNSEPPPAELKFIFLSAWIAGTTFILWLCAGLKRVRMDDKTLYVSNYSREIAISMSLIENVTENRWINIHPVTVYFKEDTPFGAKVTFMPKKRLFMWRRHPIVAELKRLARLEE
jgi:hypothetical protein